MSTVASPITDVVLLIHGIRDHGEWHAMLSATLETPAIRIRGVKYGYFDVFRFLSPFNTARRPIQLVERALRDAASAYPGARLSVVAHSFGTYVLTRVLEEHTDLRIWRVLLCGSVVKQDFRWDRVKAQIGDIQDPDKSKYIVNECGSRDIWPVLGKAAGWGYGAAGTDGFGQVLVTDRYHRGGHSLYFDRAFVNKYWKPFVHGGNLVAGTGMQRRDIPRLVGLLGHLPLRVFPFLFATIALLCLTPAIPYVLRYAKGDTTHQQRATAPGTDRPDVQSLPEPRQLLRLKIVDQATNQPIHRIAQIKLADAVTIHTDDDGTTERLVRDLDSIEDVQIPGYAYFKADQVATDNRAEYQVLLLERKLGDTSDGFLQAIMPDTIQVPPSETIAAEESLVTVSDSTDITLFYRNETNLVVDVFWLRCFSVGEDPMGHEGPGGPETCRAGDKKEHVLWDSFGPRRSGIFILYGSVNGKAAVDLYTGTIFRSVRPILVIKPSTLPGRVIRGEMEFPASGQEACGAVTKK